MAGASPNITISDLFPTETVYGIGTNGLDENAIEKLYKIKQRPKEKPITLLVSDIKMINNVAKEISKNEIKLIKKFMPGPLTIILRKKEFLLREGHPAKADAAYMDIYSKAKKSVYIVDNYINIKTLRLLQDVKPGVTVTIFSDNTGRCLHQTEYDDFMKEYPNVNIILKTTEGIYHDRYIFIDHKMPKEVIFHCGGSSKDGGKRITSISQVEDAVLYQNVVSSLERNPALQL